MNELMSLNLQELFVPQGSLLGIFVRGTSIYFLLLVLFRIFPRQAGGVGLSDLLVVVLIADASQNALAGEYKTITEGVALICTLIFWDRILDWLAYHVPFAERLLQPAPTLLVKSGRMLAHNLRKQLLTRDELMSHLRDHGVSELKQVSKAFMEGDGRISVLRAEAEGK